MHVSVAVGGWSMWTFSRWRWVSGSGFLLSRSCFCYRHRINKAELKRIENSFHDTRMFEMCLKHHHCHLSFGVLRGSLGPLLSTICSHCSEHSYVESLNSDKVLLSVADTTLKIQMANLKWTVCMVPFCSFNELYRARLHSSCCFSLSHYLKGCQLVVRRDNQ